MHRRYFKVWLVVLNLLAFNAYAVGAVATFASHRHAMHASQTQAMHQGCNHQSATLVTPQQTPDRCDMPCCKDRPDKPATSLSDHCSCKLGNSTIQAYGVVMNGSDIAIDDSNVDAMSTILILQDRTQRLFRPPIQ